MTRRAVRVAIVGHTRRVAVRRAAMRARRYLAARGARVRVHENLAEEMDTAGRPLNDLASWCDVMLSLGGDGTALTGARALVGRAGALLPVNLGGLGFLTVAEQKDLNLALRSALDGSWEIRKRRIVGGTLKRSGRVLHRGIALNDVTVKGGYAAIHLRMHALGSDLGHLVADGLVAATPSGSTAYSLSAGGPVVAPGVDALIVTPVCAHSLGSRSLVVPPGDPITLRLMGTIDRTLLLFDGQESIHVRRNDEVELKLERRTVKVFHNPRASFADALLDKLGWQGSEKRSL